MHPALKIDLSLLRTMNTVLYDRKRGSASYIVREVREVRERERERDTERERERERERRK